MRSIARWALRQLSQHEGLIRSNARTLAMFYIYFQLMVPIPIPKPESLMHHSAHWESRYRVANKNKKEMPYTRHYDTRI